MRRKSPAVCVAVLAAAMLVLAGCGADRAEDLDNAGATSYTEPPLPAEATAASDSPFAGKTLVFTGTLETMSRDEAEALDLARHAHRLDAAPGGAGLRRGAALATDRDVGASAPGSCRG